MSGYDALDIGDLPKPTPDGRRGEGPVMLEILRTLASPEEVDFLVDRVFGDVELDPDSIPRARESLAFLAGAAVRCRNVGTPFEATWSLLSDTKRLDEIADPATKAFWGRVRRGMRALSSTDWKPAASET